MIAFLRSTPRTYNTLPGRRKLSRGTKFANSRLFVAIEARVFDTISAHFPDRSTESLDMLLLVASRITPTVAMLHNTIGHLGFTMRRQCSVVTGPSLFIKLVCLGWPSRSRVEEFFRECSERLPPLILSCSCSVYKAYRAWLAHLATFCVCKASSFSTFRSCIANLHDQDSSPTTLQKDLPGWLSLNVLLATVSRESTISK